MYSSSSLAAVYQCINSKNQVEFRDTPCQSLNEQENFLPYVYHKTDPKNLINQEKGKKDTQKQLKAQERKEKRIQKRLQKEAEKETRKLKRREMHCQKARENIRLIEEKLRLGCKLNRHNRLRSKLQHYEVLEHRYCSLK